MATPIICVENLVTHYGDTKVLDGISFEVQQGEIFVIIGASGSGKSTLLKHMCGLLSPTSGKITYRDKDITELDEEALATLQRTFGIAFQSSGLFNSMTIGDNVAMPIREYGNVAEALVEPLVRLKLSLVGLADARMKMPSELSGGMRKRAGLARAIALDPPLVFFDEPSAGLDPIMASGLDELILDVNRLQGTTFVLVTHELDSIRKVAHRILMLDRGKIIFLGKLEEVERTDQKRVKQFFERKPDPHIVHRNA